MPDRETVTPIWEHMKKYLIPERGSSGPSMAWHHVAWLLAYHVVLPSRHNRDALHYVLRRDFRHNAMHRYFTKKSAS